MKQLIFSFKENRIKALLVEKSGSSYDVLSGGTIDLLPNSIEAGLIKNYGEVKQKLQNLIGGVSSAKSHQIFILLSEEASFLKIIKETKESELLEDPKIQEEIPYSLKGSFSILRLLKNKNIQLAAASKDLISTYRKLFDDIGLEIESIFPEPVVFLPFLEKAQRPSLVISTEDGSVLFAVIFESGIFFSTSKHFKEGVFDKKQLAGWIKEILEREIKPLTPTLDFEALIFGEYENEIFDELQRSNILAKILNVNFRKVPTQIGDFSKYKKLAITAGLNKHLPGFHIKGSDTNVVEKQSLLPKINLIWVVVVVLGLILVAGILWLAPKISDLVLPSNEDNITQPLQSPTPSSQSAQASPSAEKEEPKKEIEEENKEEPKPVLKKSSLKIEVLNGNGTPGVASEAENFLKSKGYKVTSTGNASNYNYPKTEIRLKKSKENFRALLTKDLSSRYTVIKGAALEESSSFDTQVIIGKN